MGRYLGSSCKLCRREGIKLFLKGTRCMTPKCAIEKRNFPPGQHGKRRSKPSDYGLQLREKQKMKRIYGMLETQFRNFFSNAARKKGVTGETLIQLLERRLDNAVYRLLFAASRAEARQFVTHGNVYVNEHLVNIPSYLVRPGDTIELRKKEAIEKRVRMNLDVLKDRPVPEWLELDRNKLVARILRNPMKEDAGLPVEESTVVELYSK